MTLDRHSSLSRPSSGIHIWKYGQLPMPDWLPQHMAGGIAKNGALMLKTDLGKVRAQSGDVVIEKHGAVWVRTLEEAPAFVKGLEKDTAPAITNIGPGKARRFGTTGRTNGAAKHRSRSKALVRRPRYSPIRGALPTIEWVHLQQLSIDGAYQRSTDNPSSRRLIASIRFNFDWRLCPPLVVSRRPDDTFVIIDGQHRWLAASGREDIPQLPCCVFRYDSAEEEAKMFIASNRARRQINRLDDFYAALVAADEDALEIQQLVVDAGLKVARSQATNNARVGEIAFVSSIAKAIRKFGADITSAALTDMAIAFRGQKLHGGAIFGALIKILSGRDSGLDPDRLMSALQTQTAEQWEARVTKLKGGDSRAFELQKEIMAVYHRHAMGNAAE